MIRFFTILLINRSVISVIFINVFFVFFFVANEYLKIIMRNFRKLGDIFLFFFIDNEYLKTMNI